MDTDGRVSKTCCAAC